MSILGYQYFWKYPNVHISHRFLVGSMISQGLPPKRTNPIEIPPPDAGPQDGTKRWLYMEENGVPYKWPYKLVTGVKSPYL